jgi:hypothetical protein
LSIGVNLTIEKAVETASIQTKPACAGYKTLDFCSVRVGELCFYRREFHSHGIILTPMDLSCTNLIYVLINRENRNQLDPPTFADCPACWGCERPTRKSSDRENTDDIIHTEASHGYFGTESIP